MVYSKIQLRKELNTLNIDDIDLYEIYLGYSREDIIDSLTSGKLLKSIFHTDRNPSLGFYIGSNGSIRFKDFGGQGGDVFTAANIHHRLALNGGLFIELLQRIYEDVITRRNYRVHKEEIVMLPKERTTVDVDIREWSNCDIRYWKRGYDMDLDEVEWFVTYPVDKIYLNGKFYRQSTEKNPIYGYLVTTTNGDFFWKCYLPNQKPKFISGGEGLDFLPFVITDLKPNDNIGLIKSKKDAMMLYDTVQHLVVPNSENSTRMSKEELELFKGRTTEVYIEPDAAGLVGIELIKAQLENVSCRLFPSAGVKGNPSINDFAEIRAYLRKPLFLEFSQWYFTEIPTTDQEIQTFIHKLKSS